MADGQGRLVAGRYRLESQVGSGGMGVVWRARDEVLDRDVAVKEVLSPPGLGEGERRTLYQRAMREARSAARLSHPGIVTVHDVVEEDGRPWVVMEFVHARSLQEVLDTEGPLPPRQVADIGRQVLLALGAAHAVGILHRDVKPSNVLLADDERVVLTDFGIAVIEGEATLTQTGAFIGSPAYIAPERLHGRRASPAADLWALGAMLYAAVEGKPPFQRPDAMAVLGAVMNDEPATPEKADALLPVIEGLLRKEPDRRMTSTAAMPLLDAVAQPPAVTDPAVTRADAPPRRTAAPRTAPTIGGTRLAPTAETHLNGAFGYIAAATMVVTSILALVLAAGEMSDRVADWLDLGFLSGVAILALAHVPLATGLYAAFRREQPWMCRATLLLGLFGAATLAIAVIVGAVEVSEYERWTSELSVYTVHVVVWALQAVTGVWLALTGAGLWRLNKSVAASAYGAFVLWILAFATPIRLESLLTVLFVLLPIVYGTWAVGVGRLLGR
jgi:hypothetical protein